MSSTRNPREEVAADAGIGGYGKDFAPQDREFQQLRMKARDVMDGNQSFTMKELQKIVARHLLAR
jgi:hypothetical protein